MYRKPGSPGVLRGVLSGPYAAEPRTVDATKLSRAARQRLADALSGRGDPTPILHDHPSRRGSRFAATWGAVLAVLALTSLTALGFADPRASWAYQPRHLALFYAAAAMLLTFSLLAIFRRRAMSSGGTLVPGRYLLPLDVVEVPPEQPDGEQLLIVTPLGRGRDARVRTFAERGASELVLVFDGGSEITFTLRSTNEGEHAMRRLEHTQTLLEELTYSHDLERALANDAFFDVRVDDSWAAVSPSGPASRARRKRRAFLHGKVAGTGALLVGAMLGWSAFVGRNWASDRALYLRALRTGTPESLEAYLQRATSHRADAEDLRDRLAAQRAELARMARDSRARSRPGFEPAPRPSWELTPEEAANRQSTSERCTRAVRARASTTHPEVSAIFDAMVERALRTGDPVIPVRMDVRSGPTTTDTHVLDLDARVSRMVWAFERVVSELCPAGLVRFVYRPSVPMEVAGLRGDSEGLDLKVDLGWPSSPTWTHGADKIYAPTLSFEVTLHGPSITQSAGFHLAMAPPALEPTELRPRSLFTLPVVPLRPADGAAPGEVYALLGARAFDRLYDELFGLFFRGDPRVPLSVAETDANGNANANANANGP